MTTFFPMRSQLITTEVRKNRPHKQAWDKYIPPQHIMAEQDIVTQMNKQKLLPGQSPRYPNHQNMFASWPGSVIPIHKRLQSVIDSAHCINHHWKHLHEGSTYQQGSPPSWQCPLFAAIIRQEVWKLEVPRHKVQEQLLSYNHQGQKPTCTTLTLPLAPTWTFF